MASKEISTIKTNLDNPVTGITTNGIQRITAIVLNPFLTDILNTSQVTTVASWSALNTIVGSGTLIPGHYYAFSYQTIYRQPVTNIIKSGAIETIVLMANSTAGFSNIAFSPSHPNDIIHFDFNNILCEDGITARGGFITFRHDTITNISYPGDFRNILFARYLVTAAAQTAWVTSHGYSQGNIIKAPDNLVYRCRKSHSSTVFATDLTAANWELITEVVNSHIFSTATSILGGTLRSTASPVDNAIFAPGCSNCHIKGLTSALPNVVIKDTANNIIIGGGCTNIDIRNTLTLCSDIEIGTGSSEIVITGASAVKIGVKSQGILIGNSCSINTLGSNTIGAYISNNSTNNKLEDATTNTFIADNCNWNTVGLGNLYIHIKGAGQNTLGPTCADVFLYNCDYNNFESNNFAITLYYAEFCKFAAFAGSISNHPSTASAGSFCNNTFGQNCTGITMPSGPANVTQATIGALTQNITIGTGGYLDTVEIGNYCANINIGASAYFGYNRIASGVTDITLGVSAQIADCVIGVASNIQLGDNCWLEDTSIGSNCHGLILTNGTHILFSKFGKNCQNNTFNNSTIQGCSFGNNNQNISIINSTLDACNFGLSNVFTIATGSSLSAVSTGSGCNMILESGVTLTAVELGNSNTSITFKSGKTFTNFKLGTGNNHHTYNANFTRVSFTPVATTTKTFTTNLTGIDATMIDVSTDNYYYYRVNTGVATLTVVPL